LSTLYSSASWRPICMSSVDDPVQPTSSGRSRLVHVAEGEVELLMAALASQQHALSAVHRLIQILAGGPGKERAPARPAVPKRLAPIVPGPLQAEIEAPQDRAPARPLLQVSCFGRFEVMQHGRPVRHWRREKARTLLKHLVVRRGPVLQDVLLDLMWPD